MNLAQVVAATNLHECLAALFGWPDAIRDECAALATEHPGWTVYYATESSPTVQGFYAFPTGRKDEAFQLYAARAEDLGALILSQERRQTLTLWNGVTLS
jgi:hypothetical protein